MKNIVPLYFLYLKKQGYPNNRLVVPMHTKYHCINEEGRQLFET